MVRALVIALLVGCWLVTNLAALQCRRIAEMSAIGIPNGRRSELSILVALNGYNAGFV